MSETPQQFIKRLIANAENPGPVYVRCRECDGPTTVTEATLKAHGGDYALCATCTSRTDER